MKAAIYIIGFVITVVLMMPAQAALHKWVDEKGRVHYGDRVPPQYLKKNRSILNQQGVVIRRITALKTQDEIDKENKLYKQQYLINRERMIAERKIALHDRMLLDTFTTEQGLIIARDNRIGAVDSQLQLTESNIIDLEKKLEDIKNRVVSIEKSGLQVPENIHKQVVSVSRQIETYYAYVEDKTRERELIKINFDNDIKRFRELKNKQSKR